MSVNILLKRSATPSKRPTAASMVFGELNLNYDAATGGVYYEDSNNAVVKVGPAQVSATAPNSTPAGSAGNSAGEFWYDTVAEVLKIYDGAAWVAAAGTGSVDNVTGTAPITVDNTDPNNPVIGIDAATTSAAGAVQLNDSTSSTSTTEAATANAAKTAYDAGIQGQTDAATAQAAADAAQADATQALTDAAAAQTTANAALPKAGGTMTGAITAAAAGIIFSDASTVVAISNSTSTTSSTTAASATAVKGAYDLAALALPLAGGTVTGDITFSGAGVGIVFGNASTVEAISNSTSTTSSIIAASATAVKSSYDLAALALPLAGGTMSGVITFDAAQTFSVTGIQDATTVAKGVVQVGTNIAVASGVISVADGTTSAKGVVQLNNTLASTSTTLALTAAQGKALQDEIDALVVTSNLTLAGTFNATTGLVNSVTTAGTTAGFVVASAVPAAAAGNADYFLIVDVAGSSGPAGTPPYHVGDWFLSTGTAWTFLNVGFQAPSATTAVEGIVYLATDAEVQAGTDTSNKAVNPASLQSKVSDSVSTTSSTTIASSTAVKTAYDLADAAIPDSTFTAAGELIVGTGAGTYAPLSDGSTNQILATDGAGVLSWVNNTVDGVQGVTGTAPITIDNTDPANPIVEIDAATTSVSGAVQLYDDVDSTSTSLAATANAVKIAYDAALLSGITSATTIYVNNTNGNDSTGERGTTKAFLTITAALAVALNDDTIFLSPGTFTENVTLTKGVTLIGTWQDQSLSDGTTIVGNFVFDMVTPTATSAPSINHIRFVSTNGTTAFKILNNAQTDGTTVISDCCFTLAGTTAQFCFETVGTWPRSLYMRRPTFDGNIKHAAGTAAGASGYLVLDGILATGSASRHYAISTGTVEFRRPSNALSPVLQTGGVVLFTDCIAGLTPSDATTSPVFGGTGISYKGAAASLGAGTVYFNGYTPISGVVNIGANLIYGWSGLNVTPANLIISGSAVAYTTAVPAAAAVVTASQQRPRFDLLTATSSVAAANQLATVLDSANGTLYTVDALDAGVF